MLARPEKRRMSVADRVAIANASANQTGSMSSPKSWDPAFPVFDIPVNKKVLAYIPKHPDLFYTDEAGNPIKDEEGNPIKRIYMDAFRTHTIREGKMFRKVKCIADVPSPTYTETDENGNEVQKSLGWDGSCPYCNAVSDCWDLYNAQFAELCKSHGLNPNSQEAKEQLKDAASELKQKMVVQRSVGEFTFPIVVVETEEGSMKIKTDADGHVNGTPYFYSAPETTFGEKWQKAWEAMIDNGQAEVGSDFFGWWVILNYTYTPKSGEPNKRDSAKALQVSFSKREGMEQVETYFDDLTKDWDISVMQSVLVANNAEHTMVELKNDADNVMIQTREQLRMFEVSKAQSALGISGSNVSTSAESVLESFGATPIEQQPAANVSGAEPPMMPPTPQPTVN